MVGALNDPFDTCHMGVTAENVAADFGISREDQDALAAEATAGPRPRPTAGYFTEQILPIEPPGRKGATLFDSRRARPARARAPTIWPSCVPSSRRTAR